MKLYRIRDWNCHYENNRTRVIENLRWVPVPNKHDGEGFRRLMAEPNGLVLYGAWHLILQVASKCSPRGTMIKGDGTPHDAASVSLKSGWRQVDDIQAALDFCSTQIDWIEVVIPETSGGRQAGVRTLSPNGMEWNGMEGIEGKGREGNADAPPAPEPGSLLDWIQKVRVSHPAMTRLTDEQIARSLNAWPKDRWEAGIEAFSRRYAGADLRAPLATLENHLAGKPAAKGERPKVICTL